MSFVLVAKPADHKVMFQLFDDGLGDFFDSPWHLIVTMAPCKARILISSGMAVISFDLSSVLIWPSTSLICESQALTMWMADLPLVLSCEPRSVLPSMATDFALIDSENCCTQRVKKFCKPLGSILANRRKSSFLINYIRKLFKSYYTAKHSQPPRQNGSAMPMSVWSQALEPVSVREVRRWRRETMTLTGS